MKVKERYLQVAIAKAVSLHPEYFNPVIIDVKLQRFKDKKTGEWKHIKTQATPGVSDIVIMCPEEKVIWMEVKLPGKKQSPSQDLFQERAGVVKHRYIVVESVIEALGYLLDWSEDFWKGYSAEYVETCMVPRYVAMYKQLKEQEG